MGADSSTLYEPSGESYDTYIDREGARLVTREGDLTISTMPDIGIGGEASTMITTVDAGIRLLRETPTAQDRAFLRLPRISLEDVRRAVMKCRSDEQLKCLLRDDYNLPPNFLVSCLRRGVASRNFQLLDHALKFNNELPLDSSLRVEDGIILQLLQKAVTRNDMYVFQILLESGRISNKLSMRAELISLVILSAQFGNGDAVTRLCELYPTCTEQTFQGRSAFVELSAAEVPEDNLTRTLTYLLRMGVNVNTQGPNGNTALHNTVIKGLVSTSMFLLREGACTTLPNNCGETPTSLDNSRTVPCLKGIPLPPNSPLPRQASLYLAAEASDFESLKSLLAKGVPVDSMWIHGRTALSAAARKGHMDMVRYLLALGALPFPLGHVWPNLPVLHALRFGHTEIALILIEHAIQQQYSKAKETEKKHIRRQLELLLHHCMSMRAPRIAQVILSSPVCNNPEVILDKMAPIHVACRHGQLEMVKLLLSYRASPTVPSETYGNTPLHYAAFYGHTHVAEYLLGLPAVEVNCTNGQLDTPLDCVLKCQLSQVEKNKFIRERSLIFLLRRGATLQSKAKNRPPYTLEKFSFKHASEWSFVPEDTQKLITAIRDGKEPLSLCASARLAIRGNLEIEVNEDVISKLGLPYRLQRYLLFKDRFPS